MNAPSANPPRLVFEDTHLLVVSKPAGLLSQGDHSNDANLVDWARKHVGRNYIGLIHRLDRNVSGLVLLAKRTKSAQRLSQASKLGKICRVYRGIVHNEVLQDEVLEHFLFKDRKKNQVFVISEKDPRFKESKKARLKRRVLEASSNYSFVEFELETGRSHQIRVQSAETGHPLVGDPKYGPAKEKVVINRPALHAHSLSFPHPMSGEEMRFEDPPPEDLRVLMIKLFPGSLD